MLENKSSTTIVISKKAFISSLIILLVLTLIAGILTQIIPQGQYQRVKTLDGEKIIPDSFSFINQKPLPIYHFFTAWFEVLIYSGNTLVISIIIFILIIGICFAIIDKTDVLQHIIKILSSKFSKNRVFLIAIITLFFMLIGSMFGIFEEMLPLIPLILLLSKNFGWDEFMGLGMSLLATAFGFAAAISNPFTLGVAQKLAAIPVFSGVGLRLLVFISIYLILLVFLILYMKKISKKNPEINDKETKKDISSDEKLEGKTKTSVLFFIIMMVMMMTFIILTLFIKEISGFSLVFISLVFIVI
ncbi:MAG: hypothetical protein ACK4YF_08070, partial [Exilispira sp.]